MGYRAVSRCNFVFYYSPLLNLNFFNENQAKKGKRAKRVYVYFYSKNIFSIKSLGIQTSARILNLSFLKQSLFKFFQIQTAVIYAAIFVFLSSSLLASLLYLTYWKVNSFKGNMSSKTISMHKQLIFGLAVQVISNFIFTNCNLIFGQK